jgi:periplasmic protein TonB
MFDLVAGKSEHVPSTPAVPIIVSTFVQGTALAVIFGVSFLFVTRELPVVPDVLAFVAEMPASIPPPAPRAPSVRPIAPTQRTIAPALSPSAPLEAPRGIEPELTAFADDEEGVPGGVEGGIAAGVVGNFGAVVEGPPPPPPTPPAVPEIVRIGGQLTAPALARRVEPIYPAVAQAAALEGVVILDAVVDADGHVQTVTVLRGHSLLAKAAIEAVKQWQYEPLRLNDVPTPFELTVSLWFHFTKAGVHR